MLKVPNLELIGKHLADGGISEALLMNIYGGHRWGTDGEFDQHHWGWTPATLREDLEKAGFVVIKQDGALNFTMWAKKP